MDGGSRKGQARCNISSDNGSRIESVVVVANSRVRDGEAWRCLYPAGISAYKCYRMPLWVKLETEPPIMSSRIDLAQTR